MKTYLIAALLVGSAVAQTAKPTPKAAVCPNIPNIQRWCGALDKWADARSDARIAAQNAKPTEPAYIHYSKTPWAQDEGAKTPTPAPNALIIVNPVQPAPFDVPPIPEEYGKPGYSWCDMQQCAFEEAEPQPCPPNVACIAPPKRRTRLTCADKRRFLMAAEDGSKHCLALSPTPAQKDKP